MKRLLSVIILSLLSISIFTARFNIQPVKASGTVYIRADGSVDPPTAPISTIDNITYTFTGNIYDSIVVERDNIVVDGMSYTVEGTGSETGIYLSGRSNVTIKNAYIKGFHIGFCFDLSLGNNLSRNTITNNDYAIYLTSSSLNTFFGNEITRNSAGVKLDSSSSNIFSRNNLMNNLVGFHLLGSVGNTLSGNNITDGSVGIRLEGAARYNRILENNITNNGQGVEVLQLAASIDYNAFYHNNFVNNAIQVRFTQFSEDIWDDDYPSGGNYWSDYTGVDLYSGPYQNETGSDGIGDTSHIIDAKNRDRYPLMNPWTPPPTPDFSLTASPTSLIIQQGNSDTSTITIASVNGFDQPVQLTVSEAPTGVTTTLNPEQVIPPPDGSTTSSLTVSVATTATLGSHTLTLTGTNGTLIHSVNVSLEITAVPPIITFDLSPGWGTKELFVPIFYRFREEPSTFALGVHNRRDMWYLVEVYRRRPNQDWERIYPWDLPYLQPWGERTFSYTPQAGDEIKIAVWNDLNDEGLRNLWVLDFTARTIFGVSISPQVTNPQEFKIKLATFYNEILTAVGYMRIGEWKKAALELGNILATNIKAREALVSVLKHVGIEVTTEVIKALLIPFRYIKNILSTGAWRLITNANKEPFTEEVIFTAKEKTPPATPDARVTKGLTIVQKEPYYVGQTITAQFTITNRGTAPITFNILTVGGRGPKGDADVRDFTFKTDITLNAGDSYNYQGELKPLDNGTYHFFIAYQTPDGKWETSVAAEVGATNTVDIFVNPIPEKWIATELGSPAELRVSDSQGRITGLTNGVEKIEIPHSTYYQNIVVILAPADSYKYEVVGTSEGSYKLIILNGTAQKIITFNATDIPTTANAIHRYTVDWMALTRGEKGVTIQIDSDGDGMFELTFTSDSELTREEFMLQITPKEAFPLWIVGAVVAIIATVSAGVAVFWRKRKQQVAKG